MLDLVDLTEKRGLGCLSSIGNSRDDIILFRCVALQRIRRCHKFRETEKEPLCLTLSSK